MKECCEDLALATGEANERVDIKSGSHLQKLVSKNFPELGEHELSEAVGWLTRFTLNGVKEKLRECDLAYFNGATEDCLVAAATWSS